MIFHYGLGIWDGMRLGAWTTYPWMGCVGGFILCEALLPTQQWAHAIACSLSYLALFAASSQGIYEHLVVMATTRAVTATGAATVCFFAGVALFNGYCCYGTMAPLLLWSTPPRDVYPRSMYRNIYHYGAINSKACGLALLLFFAAPLYVCDPDLATQHPYAPGAAFTGLVFFFFGALAPRLGPVTATWLLGEDSNEHLLVKGEGMGMGEEEGTSMGESMEERKLRVQSAA